MAASQPIAALPINSGETNSRPWDDSGEFDPGSTAYAAPVGHEVAGSGLGGHYVASFYPSTEPWYYGGVAFLSVSRTPKSTGWPGWGENHPYDYGTWYGDIGLAGVEDGGAVLLWSRVQSPVGLFARRFNPAGEVTAVEPVPSPAPGLSRLRFVPGVGVTATIMLGSAGPARFELYDVAGRRIASQAVSPVAEPGRGAPSDVTLAGTARLPSGLYFGRVVAGANAANAKLVIAR